MPRGPNLFQAYAMRNLSIMFDQADDPLARTAAYPGDPGVVGDDAVSWRVVADASSFLGAMRALLLQAAHPEVAAGVADHSRYRHDPLGRLSRTSKYVVATTYGAMPEVKRAVALVRRRHGPVQGVSHRARDYSAEDPRLAAWVHNTLTESFLVAYREFGPRPLPPGDEDRFVAEQARIGRLLDAHPLPLTAAALTAWIEGHSGLHPSPGMREAVSFLASPPLPLPLRPITRAVFAGAAATISPRIRGILGVRAGLGGTGAGRAAVRLLRWGVGDSPDWRRALRRVGRPLPPDARFLRPEEPDQA